MVEFVLVLPLVLLVLLGGIGGIYTTASYVQYVHALAMATRTAAIDWQPLGSAQAQSQAEQTFETSLGHGLDKSGAAVTPDQFSATANACSNSGQSPSCVYVSAVWQPPAFPLFPRVTFHDTQALMIEPY